ncbi:ATP-binding protein [Kitasatospora sp. NBC_00240]|uniref:ATP-binding protein n=1 Tax=Kitasatospora sp. NBC_00240 TaxID=2903567 RepID=UPI00225A5F40|nr:ATP-binding protein [Kitasatospora sp. NBC_00240]MCX5213558.1 ATP-binding protein [Kitasatospora sp. NBC_00240]
MSGPGTTYLVRRLALVERRVRRAVAARRDGDPQPDDSFRGMYLSPEAAERLLARRHPDGGAAEPAERGPEQRGSEELAPEERPEESSAWAPAEGESAGAEAEAWADEAEACGAVLPLRALVRSFGLSAMDVELLLITLLPDADARFEQLYGYLNDDVTRRRACAALAFELLGVPPLDAAARARLAPGSPLLAGGLLLVEEGERPFLGRSLRVPDRVTAHLLGDGAADPALRGLLRPVHVAEVAGAGRLAAALAAGVRLAYLRERPGGSASALAVAALAGAGRAALCLDLTALAAEPHPEAVLPALSREVRLLDGGLVAGPVEALEGDGRPEQARLLRELARLPVPVLLTGTGAWDPLRADDSPLLMTAGQFTPAERAELFEAALDGAPVDPELDLAHALAPYLLTPDQVRRAAAAARRQALLGDGDADGPGQDSPGGAPVALRHLRAGVRSQNAAGLERLARRVEPAVGWADLVLPEATGRELGELALRARHRDQVLGRWRMRPGGGRGRGVMALFAGDSGTGKTMSAEVVAADLGLDLYVVDLSTVVDKFVGETEKNLERIFTEAAGVNGILLFDEADAIFGKRSEVKDAHDRYANMESAYLLQRMESFDGIAVLTTNLRANLDEAFTRRLDVIVDFPVPDTEQRRALWDRCLGPDIPRADDIDLAFCARFELAGGSIRACAVTAAYLAAEAGRPVAMTDLVAAVRREYRKLGRLVLPHEFGRWA